MTTTPDDYHPGIVPPASPHTGGIFGLWMLDSGGLGPYAADAQRIVARFGKKESTIVGIDAFGQMTGPAERHQILIPANPS